MNENEQSIYKCEKCGIIRVFPLPEDGNEPETIKARCVRCDCFRTFYIEQNDNIDGDDILEYIKSVLGEI